ncbi:MAG: TIR domain-containing protein [Planctomycetota bacterium]|jgi:hypothetical protein
MSETFGSRLKRFALSVDIVDDIIFQRTWDLVKQYLTEQLKPAYWALLVESQVDNERGLYARECSEGGHMSFSLMKGKDEYNGLAAYSFGEGKPLWLVSPDKEPLDPNTSIKDKWSKVENLPCFDRPSDAGIRTVVFVPLRQMGRTIGLLDLQSPQYTEITKKITDELILVADTLTVLLTLLDINKAQRDHTLEAINLHGKALSEESWPPLTKPKIFVASSGEADGKVMGAICSVLDEFSTKLDVHYWKDSSTSGNINLEILQQVKESQFGLCYFSEPVEDPNSEYKYQDNINVVFEAGMFQSQTNPNVTDDPTGWIPIREQPSPPPPFDFAQQRMIIVERLTEGNPNIDKLEGSLKDRINALLRR